MRSSMSCPGGTITSGGGDGYRHALSRAAHPESSKAVRKRRQAVLEGIRHLVGYGLVLAELLCQAGFLPGEFRAVLCFYPRDSGGLDGQAKSEDSAEDQKGFFKND